MPPEYAVALTAFWFGVVSAVSLPFGAVTSRFRVPDERTMAGLVAFVRLGDRPASARHRATARTLRCPG